MRSFSVYVPASTSNIGPGFDCVGLAVNLWNEARFYFDSSLSSIEITAEGYQSKVQKQPSENLIFRSFLHFFELKGIKVPEGLRIHCVNRVPIGSGLGSSSTAILIGLLAADELLGTKTSQQGILEIAAILEGHPDNVTPAIFGGLTAASMDETGVRTERFPIADWNMAVVVPHFNLSTKAARKALPDTVPFRDAVFNLNHAIFLMRALQDGDEEELRFAMQDRLHQQYRMRLIPGSEAILQAGVDAGAAATGLSGAGPGVIAFSMGKTDQILAAMLQAAHLAGYEADGFELKTSSNGAWIMPL